MISFKLEKDGITPYIARLKKNVPKVSRDMIDEILKYGQARATYHLKGIQDTKLREGVTYQVMRYEKEPVGYLIATAVNSKGFDYAHWVNHDVPIKVSKGSRYFSSKHGNEVWYGSASARSPSEKKIMWRADIIRQKGYFDLAVQDIKDNMVDIMRFHQERMSK